jgi:hypothetical protein
VGTFAARIFVAVVAAFSTSASIAQSSFGDSVILTTANPTCPLNEPHNSGVFATLPVSVSVPSRLMAMVTLSTGAQAGTVYAAVTSADGMTPLGTISSGSQAWQAGQDQQFRPPITAQGVVHQGMIPIDPAAPILVLQPRSYQVQLRIQYGDCGHGFTFTSATPTYLLLSSVFDRVFANGFA